MAEALVARIDATGKHDSIEIAALYLSQRELVRALLDAARRGVSIRLLLDPGQGRLRLRALRIAQPRGGL